MDQENRGDEAGKADAKEKATRIYRACVHCRQRKSRCQLDAGPNPGLPPCRRCKREARECVLAGSRRGGRRTRKSAANVQPNADSAVDQGDDHGFDVSNQADQPFDSGDRTKRQSWESWPESAGGRGTRCPSANVETMDNTIASAEIQNPSDALNILAQVAGGVRPPGEGSSAKMQASGLFVDFPPYTSGQVSLETLVRLFARYHKYYHPYFPIVPEKSFNPAGMSALSSSEPHLFSAILTIASADAADDAVHHACAAHTRRLIADLIYGGDGDVEAVEALLTLSEWATVWQKSANRGAGIEDRSAWMLVGMAVRLGVYLGLEQTSFRSSGEGTGGKGSQDDHFRRRLTWAACYMADRHVSVRAGKGFWSRGPGPTTFFEPKDFPQLGPKGEGGTNYASIFKANLELIQILSNCHDIYFGRGMKSILSGGTYGKLGAYPQAEEEANRTVKYIDDFRTAIKGWGATYMNEVSTYPRHLRNTMLLSYHYVRLYVNAFAFQASFPRLNSKQRGPYSNVASLPDARFIYESMEAAKSLLTVASDFGDPEETLRFLPQRYFLYIIHSSVFLYKATVAMNKEEKEIVQQKVSNAVACMQRSSTGPTSLVTKYAELISLLWRKPQQPTKRKTATSGAILDPIPETNGNAFLAPASLQPPAEGDLSLNQFSWLDLSAVDNFATRNNGLGMNLPEFDLPTAPAAGYMDVFADGQQWFDESSPGWIF